MLRAPSQHSVGQETLLNRVHEVGAFARYGDLHGAAFDELSCQQELCEGQGSRLHFSGRGLDDSLGGGRKRVVARKRAKSREGDGRDRVGCGCHAVVALAGPDDQLFCIGPRRVKPT